MDRTHKMTAGLLVGVVASISLSSAVVLNRGRIAHLIRWARNDIARRNLCVRYLVCIDRIDTQADMLAIAFVDKHRGYFNKLAEHYRPAVNERGQYLLQVRNGCRAVVGMLLIRDLAQQYAAELEKLDAKSAAKQAVDVAKEINDDAERVFAAMRRTDIPLNMLISDYEAVS